MKYILKKDFLFTKAGKEVRIFIGSSQSSILFNTATSTIDLFISASAETLLVEEGWIEKVKPKKWYELRNNNLNALYSEKHFLTEEQAIAYAHLRYSDYKIVKVSEVLE